MEKLTTYLLAFVLIIIAFFQGCDNQSNQQHGHFHDDEPGTHPTEYPDRIVATWKDDPATTLSVTWRTKSSITEGKALVAIADASPNFYDKADTLTSEVTRLEPEKVEGEQVEANYHSVTFRDLKPDTIYAYRVGKEDHWSEWFHVRTASEDPEPFSFLYLGDLQNGILSHGSRVMRAAYSEEPEADLIIHAGDLINKAHRNVEWARWNRAGGWIHKMLPTIAIPGNHEYAGYTEELDEKEIEELSIHWRPQFEFPLNGPEGLEETVYYIDYQGVRFIGLNSNEQLEKQAKWLEKVLEDNPNKWTIVTQHYPIYSSAKGRDKEKLRKTWKPIFDEYHVDLVLQGHDHTYARGQTKNIKSGLNTRDPISGTVYVNSVSGAKMYEVKEKGWDPYGGVMKRSGENTQLYQVIHVKDDKLKYRAYTVTGELYDAFDLVQQPDDPINKLIEREPEVEERTHENTIPYKLNEEAF